MDRRFVAGIFLGSIVWAGCGGGGGGGSSAQVLPATTPGQITSSSSSLSFSATGPSAAQTLTISEPGYSGGFTASGCSGVATISAGTQQGSFVITPIAAGSCSISILNASGATLEQIPVVVTTVEVVAS
jgi:hypothetical protein